MTMINMLYANISLTLALIVGMLLILVGVVYRLSASPFKIKKRGLKKYLERLYKPLELLTSPAPLKYMKKTVSGSIELILPDETPRQSISSLAALFLTISGVALSVFLSRMGSLWYSKLALLVMGLILPFYLATLLLDIYRARLARHIPKLIDEFRSAFITHNRVRPALRECSKYLDRGLGKIISRASDSVHLEESLSTLKKKFDNIWFGIFTILLINYKESGGNLTEQLYRLNRTMTRQSSIERKKAKRLVWYEVFIIGTVLFSIPCINFINGMILGQENLLADPRTNTMTGQLLIFCAISLAVVRILRKL
jgi:Flp pilus assembly protein TadB